MVKNDQKCQKIANNCKISEITKYGEKITKIYKNVKQCKKMQKMCLKRPQNGQISEILFLNVYKNVLHNLVPLV